MKGARYGEVLRKSIHILMGAFALLLPYLPWWGIAALAAGAVISNATWIPHLGGGVLMRGGERESPFKSGVWLYSLAVLLLVLIFPRHLEVVAGAWGILALGDGFATLAGLNLGGARLPWNRAKSWSGFSAFLVAGTAGGAFMWAWTTRGLTGSSPPFAGTLLITGCAALVCALVESLSLKLNDNLSVPFVAAGILYSLQRVDPQIWRQSAATLSFAFLTGLGVNLAFALVALWVGAVSISGVAGGLLVGVTIATFTGLEGFAVLAFFFIVGSAATRLGYARKARRGIAQEKGGARGAVHALANCSVAAYLAFLSGSVSATWAIPLKLAFVSSLATAACDTLGSEIGPLGSSRPFLITRLSRVPAGTPGAVSLLGTTAGALGALLVGVVAMLLHIFPGRWIAIVPAAAVFGSLLESVLGATLEPMDLVDSETINFINTLAGALAALVLLIPLENLG